MVGDVALLQLNRLQLITKRCRRSHKLGTIVLDQRITHINNFFIIFDTIFQIILNFCTEFWIENAIIKITFSTAFPSSNWNNGIPIIFPILQIIINIFLIFLTLLTDLVIYITILFIFIFLDGDVGIIVFVVGSFLSYIIQIRLNSLFLLDKVRGKFGWLILNLYALLKIFVAICRFSYFFNNIGHPTLILIHNMSHNTWTIYNIRWHFNNQFIGFYLWRAASISTD